MIVRPHRLGLALLGAFVMSGPVLGVLAAPASAGALAAAPRAAATCNTDTGSYDDFDRDGKPDYVVALSGATVGAAPRAGQVEIHYGDGTVQGLALPDARTEDRFGTSVATFALGPGPCDGLLVGAPGRSVAGNLEAGAVAVFWHPADNAGGKPVYRLSLDQGDLAGSPQPHAEFGNVLAAGPAAQGGDHPAQTVYIGAPGYDVAGHDEAGAVVQETLTAAQGGQIAASTGTLLTEGAAPVGGAAAAGDQFGAAIGTNGAIIGAAGKTVAGHRGAGAVYVRTGTSYRLVTQDTAGVPGAAEDEDQFGSSVRYGNVYGTATYAVGAPGEAIGAVTAAGTVTTFAHPAASGALDAHTYYQGKDGIPGSPENGDGFGKTLGGTAGSGLLIGAPGEDVGDARDAGAVYQPAHEPGMTQSWTENSAGIPGTAETDDNFGAAIGNNGDRVLVGVPGEDGSTGIVIDGLPRFDQTSVAVHRGGDAPAIGDTFGDALTGRRTL